MNKFIFMKTERKFQINVTPKLTCEFFLNKYEEYQKQNLRIKKIKRILDV